MPASSAFWFYTRSGSATVEGSVAAGDCLSLSGSCLQSQKPDSSSSGLRSLWGAVMRLLELHIAFWHCRATIRRLQVGCLSGIVLPQIAATAHHISVGSVFGGLAIPRLLRIALIGHLKMCAPLWLRAVEIQHALFAAAALGKRKICGQASNVGRVVQG